MCGIVGIYSPKGTPDLSELQHLTSCLAHRGPDGQGFYQQGPIALGHARLSIIDLEHGQQPLYSQCGRYVLVANGEIYNAPELRAECEAEGYQFSTGSDCEVILALRVADPEHYISRLRGMFAFALYDSHQQCLTLVRDRFGIKPLYYVQSGPRLVFASETKALLPFLSERVDVDVPSLGRFLQINFASGEQTAFRAIKRVPVGGRIDIDLQGSVESRCWWSLREAMTEQRSFQGSMDDAVEAFDEKLQMSLRLHLRSDVPVGLFLSGGVDSGILATELARLPAHAGTPRAWSLGFDSDSVQDEASAAAEIALACGLELEVLRVNPISLFQRLVYSVWAADELMGDFASLPTLLLAEAAAATHKVVLSGEGGDEVFAGYGRYRMPRWQRWLNGLRAPGSGGFRTRGRFDRRMPHALIRAGMRDQLLARWREPFIEQWQRGDGLSVLQSMQYTDMQTWLVDDLLIKADRMLMVAGVEGRVPYLDHELVLFGLSLPEGLKIKGRLGKQVPRAWLQRHQQGINASGRKKGFTVPVADWVRSLDRQALLAVFKRSPLIMEWFDLSVLQASLSLQGPLPKSLIEPLAALVQLAIWEKLFIEQRGCQPPRCVDPLSWLLDQS